MKQALTAEESIQLEAYRQARWVAARQPVNRGVVEEVLSELFSLVNEPLKEVRWFDSPYAVRKFLGKKWELPWFTGDGWSMGWLSLYAFCDRFTTYEPEARKKLLLQEKLSAHAGWIWSFKNMTLCSERPVTRWTSELLRDRPVLHCPTGPSVKFKDGYELYHWRGQQVDRQWIMNPASIPRETALTHPNIELRRTAAEIIGWDNVLKEIPQRILDKDPNPMIGTLFECDIPDAPRTKFLRVLCATGRTFVLLAQKDAKTAKEANAASFGVPTSILDKLELRT